jgi:hypothetical protein
LVLTNLSEQLPTNGVSKKLAAELKEAPWLVAVVAIEGW